MLLLAHTTFKTKVSTHLRHHTVNRTAFLCCTGKVDTTQHRHCAVVIRCKCLLNKTIHNVRQTLKSWRKTLNHGALIGIALMLDTPQQTLVQTLDKLIELVAEAADIGTGVFVLFLRKTHTPDLLALGL